jgi:hypothetical protein
MSPGRSQLQCVRYDSLHAVSQPEPAMWKERERCSAGLAIAAQVPNMWETKQTRESPHENFSA